MEKNESKFERNEVLSVLFNSDAFFIVTSFTVINDVFSLSEMLAVFSVGNLSIPYRLCNNVDVLSLQRYFVLLDIPCMLVTQVYRRLMVISVITTRGQVYHPQMRIVIVIT
jgi:hypothetical protein